MSELNKIKMNVFGLKKEIDLLILECEEQCDASTRVNPYDLCDLLIKTLKQHIGNNCFNLTTAGVVSLNDIIDSAYKKIKGVS